MRKLRFMMPALLALLLLAALVAPSRLAQPTVANAASGLTPWTGTAVAGTPHADGSRTLPAQEVPAEVLSGQAVVTGPHAAEDTLLVLFMLPLRDHAGLNAFLADVSNPQSPNYGQYLTEAEETARFGPTAETAQQVTAWLKGAGIADVKVPADRLYVEVHATTASLEQLLQVHINDYKQGTRAFYAPAEAPTLPAAVAELGAVGGGPRLRFAAPHGAAGVGRHRARGQVGCRRAQRQAGRDPAGRQVGRAARQPALRAAVLPRRL